ncbi:MAG TPA: CBS domain-containing protein [Thermoanaerobaculia bacterium]|nr:CBS domain-containing protein [Thermoanaerobaculia bacterium]
MKVQELMTRSPATCTPNTPAQKAARLMEENDCGMIPVVEDGGSLVGVIAQADLALEENGIDDREVGEVVEAISEPRPSGLT